MSLRIVQVKGTYSSGPGVTVPFWSTGVDASGVKLAEGATDPHWTLTESADENYPGPNAVRTNIPAPYPSGETRAAPISSQYDIWFNSHPAGVYEYTQTFTLPEGTNLTTAAISGQMAWDNSIVIYLNDVEVYSGDWILGATVNFTISGAFVVGVNTVRVRVTNFEAEGLNPSAFYMRVDSFSANAAINIDPGAANQVLAMNSDGSFWLPKTLTAGDNVTITHSDTAIAIEAAGGSGLEVGSANQVLAMNDDSPGSWVPKTLTQGDNITLTHSDTAITIAATGGGGLDYLASLVDPTGISFAWRNQGSATITTRTKSLFLYSPAGSGNIRGREIDAPSAPWSVSIGFIPSLHGQNYQQCGLYVGDGTKLETANVSYSSQPNCLGVTRWNSATSYASSIIAPNMAQMPCPMWLKVYDDNTNIKWYWSVNGIDWIQLTSNSRTAWLSSVSKVGFWVDPENGNYGAGILLVSWSQGTS